MTLPTPDPNAPIPNGPFYSPQTTYLAGPYHPWIADSTAGFDFATGGFSGGGGGSGTITQINTGTGLTGGPITVSGTISIAPSGVTAGSYTYPSITVNASGQIVSAVSGATPLPLAGGTMSGLIVFAPGQTFPGTITSVAGSLPISVSTVGQTATVSVADASTTQKGVVQLQNTTTSTATNLALTAAQGKFLQDQIDALVVTNNITLAGTYDANTGLVDGVTIEGSSAGFVVGSALPAAAAGNLGFFVIVDTQGSIGPSGVPPYTAGDWFLSDGTSWQFLNVGFDPPYATTADPGVIQLATSAQTITGTDATLAVTPATLSARVASLTATGIVQLEDSITSTSITTAATPNSVRLAVDSGIPKALLTAKGSLVAASAASTPAEQPVGATGTLLSADPASSTGLTWINTVDGGSY